MKREFRILVASVALCAVAFCASAASAEEEAAAAPEGPKTTGFYFGAGLGGAVWDEFEDESFAWRANVLWRSCKYFGAEVEWLDVTGAENTFAGTSVGLNADGFNLSAVPMFPIGDKATLFAKVGLYLWDADYDNAPGQTGEDLSFGIGGMYEIRSGWGLRAEWTRLMLDVRDDKTVPFGGVNEDVDVFTVGGFFHY